MKKVLFLAALGVGLTCSSSAQEVTEIAIPTAGFQAEAITTGPDGNLWFTEYMQDTNSNVTAGGIGRITPDGVISEFPTPTASVSTGITGGPDGNVWFTGGLANYIGRITPEGVVTEFSIPTQGSLPQGITVGLDGNLWFTEQNGPKIGKMTTTGTVIGEFVVPTAGSSPGNITAGPDGNLWFTEQTTSRVGRVTPSGEITEFEIPTPESIPHGIVTGPDGNLWFVQSQGAPIARVTPAGLVTEQPSPPPADGGLGIAAGPDGNLWFTELLPKIGRITTSGDVTEFTISGPANSIAAGPDGSLWFTEPGSGLIGRITTGPCAANPTTLCANGSRYSVRATWAAPSENRSGQANAVPLSGDSGYFWFFDPGNVELVVKVLNGCLINGHTWVFAGGLTNVEVSLIVRDTETGESRTYASPGRTPFPPIQDTSAFATCP